MTRFLLKHRIKLTLVLGITLIGITPLVPSLTALLPWSIVGACVLFALLAGMVRERFDMGLALMIAAAFTIARFMFPNPDGATLTLRVAALSSYFLLHVVLLIGPWSRFVPKIREWYKHRRHLGVTTFLLGLLHSSIVLGLYFNFDILQAWQAVFVFFGSTALFVMSVLAITSWDWWQKHVPWKLWKIAHAAVLAVYLIELWILRGIWSATGDIPSWTTPAFVAFIVFWILIAPWGFAPRMFKVLNGWKQLHVLIYIAYVSVVIHLYFGAAEAQGLWAQATVLGLLALVMGSHLAGWIRNWQEKKRATVAEPAEEPWHNVASLSELKEGEGRRVDIHGLPIALFLHEGNVRAFFGYCAHQKGPLWEGKIIQGYLTCPWHGWQYSVEEGKGPPGFPDSIPFYPTKVESGRVWVRVEKETQCQDYGCKGCSCRA